MSRGRRLAALLAPAALLAAPRAAGAFSSKDFFHTPPSAGVEGSGPVSGATAIYFTGSQRFQLHTCAECHLNAPGRVRLDVRSSPAGLLDAYQPGMQYMVEVRMVWPGGGETLGAQDNSYLAAADPSCAAIPPPSNCCDTGLPGSPVCNTNEFALDVTDAAGRPTGTLAGSAQVDVDPTDPTAAISLEYQNDPSDWTFSFTAPAAGTGPIVISAAGVDGNGGDGTAHDIVSDDVATFQVVVPEAGSAPPTLAPGCAASPAGGEHGGTALLLIASLAGLAGLGRRRRRARG